MGQYPLMQKSQGMVKLSRANIKIRKKGEENTMADTQITILGMSGSGKTCYLLGLYYKMGAGMKGYTITTDDDTDVKLRDRYARLCDVTLDREKRFPAGTDNLSKYEFDLQYGYNTIMSFDWVDYPGGLLDRKNSGNLEEYENLKKAINNSSSLFICVDGSLLLGDDIDEKIDNVRDNCSNIINPFFAEYFKSNNELPATAIIVTKYDVCKDDTDAEELCQIIEEAFSPFFVKNDNKKIVTIIPVSIGTNIMDNDCSGKMKPLNIHLPIFMGIWFALNKKIQAYVNNIQNKEIMDASDISLLRDKKEREENKRILKREIEVEKLAREIQETEQQTQQMKYILNAMVDNRDKLIRELEKIPYVYINGERSSFSDIIK